MHYELLTIAAIAYIVAVDFAFRRVLFEKRAQLAYSDPIRCAWSRCRTSAEPAPRLSKSPPRAGFFTSGGSSFGGSIRSVAIQATNRRVETYLESLAPGG